MATIPCPICAGPLELSASPPTCQVGHAVSDDDLPHQLSVRATRALWAAVRALEDQAATARWRAGQPDPPAYMNDAATTAAEQAALVRQLLQRRERRPS